MKTLLFALIAIFSLNMLHSQSNDEAILDSIIANKDLKQQYKIVAKELRKYNSENLQSRLFFSRALLDIAKQTNDDDLIGNAWYDLAYSYEIIGQYDLCIDACFQALKYLEKADNISRIGMTYN